MGGRDAVFAAAVEAGEQGDQQWAAELTTHLIRINHDDLDARNLKAEALRQLGYTHTNNNWRNWYLTSAQELDGTIDFSKRLDIQAPDMLRAFPTSELINGFRYRLKAEDTLDVSMTMGFRFPDVDEEFGLEIRRGVVQFYDRMPDVADIVLEMDRATLMGMLLGELDFAGKTGVHPDSPQAALAALFQSGDARLTRGSAEDFARFFSYFEPMSSEPIALTIR